MSKAITKALQFIATQQQADGGFISYTSSTKRNFSNPKPYQTTFVPSLVLGSLANTNHDIAVATCSRLVEFVLKQANKDGSYNYWSQSAPQRKSHPYPNDLDDTFCALIGLQLYKPTLITPERMVKVIKLLVATETKTGGPYRTWLVSQASPSIWLDVDVAVNANIAYFLHLREVDLPNLIKLTDEALRLNHLQSPYYPSSHMTLYYMSRLHRGNPYKLLMKKLEQLLSLPQKTPLQNALLLSSCLHLKGASRQLIQRAKAELVASQNSDGSWSAEAFCLDPAIEGKPHYNGCAVLTTAFACQALHLLSQEASEPQIINITHVTNQRIIKRLKSVTRPKLDVLLQKRLISSVQEILDSKNGEEIINFVNGFAQSLQAPSVSQIILDDLIVGSLCGWVAYTIYDDFLDDEGQPSQLSLANVAMRYSLRAFYRASPAQDFIQDVFDVIDAANLWELTYCRFKRAAQQITITSLPDYGNLEKLAERSLGHILPPLLLLQIKGCSKEDLQLVQKTLEHYLIAKQLNDDLHDWQDDLKRGHCSYVVATLLRELSIKPGVHTTQELINRSQRHFWKSTLTTIGQEVKEQLHAAQNTLSAVEALPQPNILTKMIHKSVQSIEETLQTQTQTEEFLKQFKEQTS